MEYNFRFVVDSQSLHTLGELEIVEAQAKEMATELSKVLLYHLIYKATTKSSQEITGMVVLSPADDVESRAMVRVA